MAAVVRSGCLLSRVASFGGQSSSQSLNADQTESGVSFIELDEMEASASSRSHQSEKPAPVLARATPPSTVIVSPTT
jgi:hypothetical protein